MMNFHVLCEKVEKSWNRTPGWISREAVKVLCFIRFWERYLRPGAEFSRITPFYGIGWNSTTFHENEVILHHFQLRGVKMVPGRPRGRNINETYAFPMPF